MAKFEQFGEATYTASNRLAFGFWASRLADMMEHASRHQTRDGSTAHSRLSVDRVARGWPQAGSILVTREFDGAKIRLYRKGSTFKVETIGA